MAVCRRGLDVVDRAAKPITMLARATPTPGSDSTFMQQLLGNIGRFTPGGLGGLDGGGGSLLGQSGGQAP